MKIKALTLDSFVRVPHMRLEPKAPIVLLAGPNEAGKSSVKESFAMLLLDESPRVKYKKDRGELIHGGARQGSIQLEVAPDLVLTRFVRDGKVQGDGGLLPGDKLIAGLCIQHQTLTALDDATRRGLLMQLAKVDLSVDTIATKLLEKGVDKDVVAKMRPLLKGGLKPAWEKSKREASDAKGAWREVTGEAYGSQKAEGWKPPPPAITLEAASQTLTDLDTQLAEMKTKRDAAIEASRKDFDSQLVKLRKARELALEPVVTSIATYRDQLKKPTPLACPHCGGALMAKYVTAMSIELEKYEGAGDRSQIERLLSIAELKRKEIAEEHDELIKSFEDQKADQTKVLNDEYEAMSAALSEDKAALTEQIASAEKLTAKAERATELHRLAQAHDKLTVLLSDTPEGVAAELVAASLKPLNERLIEIGIMIGWAPAAIHNDMSIVRTDGYSYGLLSESAKWRLDAMLHLLVSELSGYPLLVFDRMDVLQPGDRPKWLSFLNDYGQMREDVNVFCMATLKAPPDLKSMPSIDVHWIEDGRLS